MFQSAGFMPLVGAACFSNDNNKNLGKEKNASNQHCDE